PRAVSSPIPEAARFSACSTSHSTRTRASASPNPRVRAWSSKTWLNSRLASIDFLRGRAARARTARLRGRIDQHLHIFPTGRRDLWGRLPQVTTAIIFTRNYQTNRSIWEWRRLYRDVCPECVSICPPSGRTIRQALTQFTRIVKFL